MTKSIAPWIIAVATLVVIGDLLLIIFNNIYTRVFLGLISIFIILVILFVIIPYYSKTPRKEPTIEEAISNMSSTMRFIHNYLFSGNIRKFAIFIILLLIASLVLGAYSLITLNPRFLDISLYLFFSSIVTFVILSRFVK